MDIEKKYYICSNCGYSPSNRSNWCAKGCGSDYNQMIEVTGVDAGRMEVVNWVKDRLQKYKVAPKLLGFTMLSEDRIEQLKEWGIE